MSTTSMSEDTMLTIDQAAAYLSIAKATLYTWRSRRAGYGPRAVKMGGCLRYRRSDLDAWIAERLEHCDPGVSDFESRRGKAPNPAAGVSLSRSSRPR